MAPSSTTTTTTPVVTAELADELERVARLVFRHRRGIVQRYGLTPPLARALHRLTSVPPRAMGELADVLECDPSNVTGIVDRLEDKGLVERRTADHDRRAKTVAVTTAGQKLARRLRAELATLPPAVDGLAATEQAALVRLLGRIG
jgi:DNA-binding MarR family transcriptional regulator